MKSKYIRINQSSTLLQRGAAILSIVAVLGSTFAAGISAQSMSLQSVQLITAMANRNVNIVSVQYITPGPSIIRTAFRSLVARDMMSPVR